MRITQVSETTFTVKGHGVHTAFHELTTALQKHTGVSVAINRFVKADIVHIHTIGAFSLAFLLLASGKKVVSAHIVPESLRGSLVGANLWMPIARVYLRWFYNRADCVFAVSDSTKRELVQLGVKKPISVVYNLVNAEQYSRTPEDRLSARKKLNIADGEWVVVTAGQVQPRKGIETFLRTAKSCPDMKFIWVGGMPFGKLAAENNRMKQLIDSATSNVTFTGVIDHSSVRKYYHASDVFCLFSTQETFGLVVVEASASGLPVVLRDIPDYTETFAKYAIMESEDTFADSFQRLRSDDDYYRQAVENSSNIAKTFGVENGVRQILDVYRSLL